MGMGILHGETSVSVGAMQAAPLLKALPIDGGSSGLCGKEACQGCTLCSVRVQPPTPTYPISHLLKGLVIFLRFLLLFVFSYLFSHFPYSVQIYTSPELFATLPVTPTGAHVAI